MYDSGFKSSSPPNRRISGAVGDYFGRSNPNATGYFGPDRSSADDQSWGRWISSSFATTTLPSMRTLPLPKLGLRPPWFQAGVRICGNRRTNHVLHVIWALLLATAGLVQMVAGIYFMMELPIFHLGSNLWTGAWNVFSGCVTLILCCHGYGISVMKAQGILLLSLAVLIANLINLVILEVGEWRGFLSDESKQYIKSNKLEDLMYYAYMTTTISTVTAMIVSFFASQQTFCYLQIQNDQDEDEFERKEQHFSSMDSDTVLTTKDLVNRQSDLTDTLNLKTPSGGPQPHPSWVYRNNHYAPFNPSTQNPVKRSLSFLNGGHKAKSSNAVYERRYDMLGTMSKSMQGTNALAHGPNRKHSSIQTISEICREPLHSPPPIPPLSHRKSNATGTMRHAVIRRHQSMYIHPRTTTEIQATKDLSSHYKMHEVSGKSEVRPIVTLQRSKTTAGAPSNSLHYRATSIQALHNSQMRPGRTTFNASVNNYLGSKPTDFNHNNVGSYHGRKSSASSRPTNFFGNAEDLCEFQAGRSFDLPDPTNYWKRFMKASGNQGNSNSDGWPGSSRKSEGKLGCVMFDSESNFDVATVDSYDKDSCHGTIRYQAVDRQNINNHARHTARSLENLLAEVSNTPEMERQQLGGGGLKHRRHYGSTESISSLGSTRKATMESDDKPSRMTQTPTSLYSHESSTMNTSKDSQDGTEDDTPNVYDVPRKTPALQKSNSRVASTGKLRLHVESFRSAKNTNGTQTDLTVMKNKENLLRQQHHLRKHLAPPNKPIRKTKQFQPQKGNSPDCNQSDRSASPDNSSTSGYSSPSACPMSKETSPYGSKLDEKILEEDEPVELDRAPRSRGDHDRLLDENGSKVTVIQIVPASLSNGGQEPRSPSSFDDGEGSPVDDEDEDYFPTSAAIEEYRRIRERSESPPTTTRRELPRISTNGTLGRGYHKRRLPDHHQAMIQAAQNGLFDPSLSLASRLNQMNPKRMYRSNHQRPSNMQLAQGRIPLPPVPELERSDHERESISPIPPSNIPFTDSELLLKSQPKRLPPARPLPSPLSTPIQPNSDSVSARPTVPVPRARARLANSQSKPSSLPDTPTRSSDEDPQGGRDLDHMDDNLVALLELLREKSKEGKDKRSHRGESGPSGVPKQDTLQYLSQLEHVARRLKDQLLMETPGVHGKRSEMVSKIPQFVGATTANKESSNNESDC